MKTKITLLLVLAIALFSFTLASSKQGKTLKTVAKKTTTELRVGKGLAMEDKNQFK